MLLPGTCQSWQMSLHKKSTSWLLDGFPGLICTAAFMPWSTNDKEYLGFSPALREEF
jgi:hypothetical protein